MGGAPTNPASNSQSALFQPVQVCTMALGHRVVLAPASLLRATDRHVLTALAVTYYAQRASCAGSLLISEATCIAPYAAGYSSPHTPGVWNEEQVVAWRRVTDAVHEKGSYIFMQLWALGRVAVSSALRAENPDFTLVSSSDVPLRSCPAGEVPRPLTIAEIKEYVDAYAQAAYNAVHRAGLDGVEIHGANGYLVDQFLQDTCNKRTDEYGGSVENRCRFALEVIDAIASVVGAQKLGLRISPWSTYKDMGMEDPVPTFTYLVTQIVQRHPDLAYLHVIEPGVSGNQAIDTHAGESNDFLRQIWAPRAFISAGGYTRDTAMKRADETGELIAFGRWFIANPDLPDRLKKNIPIIKWSKSKYDGAVDPRDYIDYPFAGEEANKNYELIDP